MKVKINDKWFEGKFDDKKNDKKGIVFIIYLVLDIARIAIGVTGNTIGRKIMSIVLSILELLRGDWKKAVLTIVGYYGVMPLLIGEFWC
jgi:hypothetical protein